MKLVASLLMLVSASAFAKDSCAKKFSEVCKEYSHCAFCKTAEPCSPVPSPSPSPKPSPTVSPSPKPSPSPSPKPSPSPTVPAGKVTMNCAARWGEFCTDPFSNDGKKLASIFPDRVPVYCDVLIDGKVSTEFKPEMTVLSTGEKLQMTVNEFGILEAKPLLPNPGVFKVQAKLGNVTAAAEVHREQANCKSCHDKGLPGSHAGREETSCKSCHTAQHEGMDFGFQMHKHALTKTKLPGTGSNTCYQCHPAGCLDNDHHKTDKKMDCTSCHGDLANIQKGTFKISGQAGKPNCTDCHKEEKHAQVKQLFADARRADNGKACISCHGSPHRLREP